MAHSSYPTLHQSGNRAPTLLQAEPALSVVEAEPKSEAAVAVWWYQVRP